MTDAVAARDHGDPRTRPKRLILDAAAAEFCDAGPAGARIDSIAAAAGVNKRMLYHYFGSKDGLFAAVLTDRLESALDAPSMRNLAERLVALQHARDRASRTAFGC